MIATLPGIISCLDQANLCLQMARATVLISDHEEAMTQHFWYTQWTVAFFGIDGSVCVSLAPSLLCLWTNSGRNS